MEFRRLDKEFIDINETEPLAHIEIEQSKEMSVGARRKRCRVVLDLEED